MAKDISLERAIGDRLLELGKSSGCAKDAFFHHLNTLSKAAITCEHQYLIDCIKAAKKEIGAHDEFADKVIAKIEATQKHAERNFVDGKTGDRRGPVHMGDGVTAD